MLHSCFPEKQDFEVGILQCVMFWNKIIQRVRCRIKLLKPVRICKRIVFKKWRYKTCYSEKATFFAFSCSSETQYFRLKTLQCLRLGIQKWTRKQNFCPKTLQCVRIWFETFTTCQVLNLKISKRVRIWKKSLQSKNYFLKYVTPWKGRFLLFPCFFGSFFRKWNFTISQISKLNRTIFRLLN